MSVGAKISKKHMDFMKANYKSAGLCKEVNTLAWLLKLSQTVRDEC
jgi:hypothetical protein